MLLHSIRAFADLPTIREIVVPIPQETIAALPDWLRGALSERIRVVPGGETRTLSVLNGVKDLSPESTIIVVHDAARPCVSAGIISRVIDRVAQGASAIAAAPVRDTLKRSDDSGRVLETVPRGGLWHAHTPQGFPRDVLMRSYDVLANFSDTETVTDEATLVERAGFRVHLVEDSTTNLKVTTSEDFVIAEALLSQ